MKKLLTILLVLISFSSFAQFEAGEFVNTDTVKLDGVPLLLNTFKKGNLGGAGNIFYSTGVSSQPASGSINQVMANNLLNPNTVVKWDGSKFVNSGMIEIDGNVGISKTDPSERLDVGGSVRMTGNIIQDALGYNRGMQYNVDGKHRWIISYDGEENLGNLGTDIYYYRYDNNGEYLGVSLFIKRSSGNTGIKTTTPSEALDVNGNVMADVLKSRVATGTPPIVVTSTTKVDNLNVEMLDGKHASDFELANVNIQNHIENDADTVVGNEIQDLSRAGNTLSLSGDGTTVDLSDLAAPDLSGYATTTQLADQLSQTISNGVTTKAPSEDAVYDALAGKQNLITNPIVGVGSENTVPFFLNSNTVGISFIQNNAFGVGIGISPRRLFHIGLLGQPTFAFTDSRGSVGNQTMGFLFDAGISLAKPGIVWQKLSDNAGFVQNLFTFFQNGTINFDGIAYPDSNTVVFGSKKIGAGTNSPAASVHSQSTTTQLRLGYDATKYTDISTGSTGNLTIDPTGDTTKIVGAVNSTGGFFENGVKITGGGGISNIGITVPTGLTVSPDAITSNDTFAISLQSGYSIPTTANQTNWTEGYNNQISTVAFSGSTTKQITLTQKDGGQIFGYFTDLTASDWVTDTYGIKYNAGKVCVGTATSPSFSAELTVGNGSNTTHAISASSLDKSAIFATSSSGFGVNAQSGYKAVSGTGTGSGIGVYGTSSTGFGGFFEGLGCKATKYYVSSLNTAPASSSATGTTGEIRFTSDYIYVCVATNTWKRTQISTW